MKKTPATYSASLRSLLSHCHIGHIRVGMGMAASGRMSQTRDKPKQGFCSQQRGSCRSDNSPLGTCSRSFSLPLPATSHMRKSFLGAKLLEKVPQRSSILQITAKRGQGHSHSLCPAPNRSLSFPWGAELTCCGKRAPGAKVQSQDAEQQAWNGEEMIETTKSQIQLQQPPQETRNP